jgi:hypothetical protein
MFAALRVCLEAVMTSEGESTRERRRGGISNLPAVSVGGARGTRPVQHKLPLKVEHVVLHFDGPRPHRHWRSRPSTEGGAGGGWRRS